MNKKRIMSVVALLTAVSMTSATVFAAGPVEDTESTSVSARTADQGWHEDSNGWWYLDEYGEYPRACIRYIHGEKYLFDKNGYMKTGWYYRNTGDYDTGWYYFKDSGEMACREWVTISGEDYYFDYSGDMEVLKVRDGYYICAAGNVDKTPGWKCDNTKIRPYWYYVNKDGRADNMGWTEIDDKTYYFDEFNHSLATAGIHEGYFVDNNGVKDVRPGWKRADIYNNTDWYYYKEDGTFASGWTDIDGQTYYFDVDDNIMQIGNIDGYYLNDNGVLDTSPGWKYTDEYNAWYYVEQDGKLVNGWKKIGGYDYYFTPFMMQNNVAEDKYYIDKDGVWSTKPGWKGFEEYIISDEIIVTTGWYYVDKNGYAVKEGWKKIDGAYYYFSYNIVNQCKVIDGCYVDANGVWDTNQGWKQFYTDNSWFYVDKNGKAVIDRWENIDGYSYHFDEYGYMESNREIDGYFVDSSGKYNSRPGWKTDGYNWYYADNQGCLIQEGWKVIDKKYYHFENYKMSMNEMVDDCYVDDDGIWRQ